MKPIKYSFVIALITSLPFSGVAMAGNDKNEVQQQPKVSSAFGQYDRNGDQNISAEEAAETPLNGYFAALDTDGNRQVSRKEYEMFLQRYPSLIDKDATEEAE